MPNRNEETKLPFIFLKITTRGDLDPYRRVGAISRSSRSSEMIPLGSKKWGTRKQKTTDLEVHTKRRI